MGNEGGAENRGEGEPRQDKAPDDLGDEGRGRGRLDQLLPDIVRRTLYAGLGALFTTEEGIRKLAGDFQLPKDVANFLIHQAANSKDELFRIIAKEMRGFLESANLAGELQKLLTSLSFEVKTEVRFIPNEDSVGGLKPVVKREVSMKRQGNGKRARRTKKPAKPAVDG